VWAQNLTPAEEDARREAAIAEFTQRMQASNYPALFQQAAQEFNVPADILKGVAFAETRWEHLTWPPGENASPENGMPRPYGIMSLWSNQFFGYSLVEAANLIGKDPEELKKDPLQNIRGGAALLQKLYKENPKPEGTTEADIESWRNAIRKYCGIPEPDLNAQHALDVYVFMSKGYHQYGIEWEARPVNLEPMRQETRRIVAEERARKEALRGTNAPPTRSAKPEPPPPNLAQDAPAQPSGPTVAVVTPPTDPAPVHRNSWWLILAVAVVALVLGIFVLRGKNSRRR
jgi:hypothetical protein